MRLKKNRGWAAREEIQLRNEQSHENEGWKPHRIHEAGENGESLTAVGHSIMMSSFSEPPGRPSICKKVRDAVNKLVPMKAVRSNQGRMTRGNVQ